MNRMFGNMSSLEATGTVAEDNASASAAAAAAAGAAGDDTTGAAAGAAGATPEQIAAAQEKYTNDLLKKLGVTTLEELEAKVKNQPKTPEEIQAATEKYNKDLTTYAISNGLMSPTDFAELEKVRAADKVELVKNEFTSAYKELHKGRLDENQKPLPVTSEEIENAFEQFYHINSDNQALKNQGQKILEERGNSIVSAFENKFSQAKETFDSFQQEAEKGPKYIELVKTNVAANIPKELVLIDGDENTKIVFSLENVDTKPLEELFINDTVYNHFKSNGGATPEFLKTMGEAVQKELFWQNRAEIASMISKTSFERGTKSGSNTGAEAPFQQTQVTKPVVTAERYSEEEKAKLREMNPFPNRRN